MKKRALSMLRLAERLLIENEPDLSVLHSEHAAQLYVRAVLYRMTGEEYRGHSIRALLGVLATVLEEKGLRQEAEQVIDFLRKSRRELAELEEGHTRSIYGIYEYSQYQAKKLLEVAKSVIKLLEQIEQGIFETQ